MNLTTEQLLARIAELELAAKSNGKRKQTTGVLHIGKKGGVSMSIEGSWPATYTAAKWRAILSRKEEILSFIEAHKEQLAGEEVKANVEVSA